MRRRIALITVALALCYQAHSAEPCTATPLTLDEARALSLLVPAAVAAKNSGGTIEALDSDREHSYPHSDSYQFVLMTSISEGTLLDNGLIGYFAVNRTSAQVTNVADEIVVGPELAVAQAQIRSRHCVVQGLAPGNQNRSQYSQ